MIFQFQGRRGNDDSRKKESTYWKLGEAMSQSQGDLSHANSPLKDFLDEMSSHMKDLAEDHLNLETAIQKQLGSEFPLQRIIAKGYPEILKDRDLLKQKLKEKENVENRYEAQSRRRINARGDEAFEENHRMREHRRACEVKINSPPCLHTVEC